MTEWPDWFVRVLTVGPGVLAVAIWIALRWRSRRG